MPNAHRTDIFVYEFLLISGALVLSDPPNMVFVENASPLSHVSGTKSDNNWMSDAK